MALWGSRGALESSWLLLERLCGTLESSREGLICLQSSSGKAIEKVWNGSCKGNGEHHEGSRNAAGCTSLQRPADTATPSCKIHCRNLSTLQCFHLAATGDRDCKIHICGSVNHKVCDLPCFTTFCKFFIFVGYKSEELSIKGQFSNVLLLRYCCSITAQREKPEFKEDRARASHVPAQLPPLYLFLRRVIFRTHNFLPSYFFVFNHYWAVSTFLPPLLPPPQFMFSYRFHTNVQERTFASALPRLCFNFCFPSVSLYLPGKELKALFHVFSNSCWICDFNSFFATKALFTLCSNL